MAQTNFSDQLRKWAQSKGPKTIDGLFEVFGERSFAVAFVLLLFIPALPLPTGGVTHIFELIGALLALEMIAGRRTVWLPKRWKGISISKLAKATPALIPKIMWLEKHSSTRLEKVMRTTIFLRLTGLALLIFCVAAFVSPPFSGLDTLPSLAVVLLGLSLILEDILIYIASIVVGMFGIALSVALGAAIFKSFTWF